MYFCTNGTLINDNHMLHCGRRGFVSARHLWTAAGTRTSRGRRRLSARGAAAASRTRAHTDTLGQRPTALACVQNVYGIGRRYGVGILGRAGALGPGRAGQHRRLGSSPAPLAHRRAARPAAARPVPSQRRGAAAASVPDPRPPRARRAEHMPLIHTQCWPLRWHRLC